MLEIEKTIKGRFGKEIKPEGNVLRIGASTVPAQYILPNVMSTFHAEYPGEKLKLFETDSEGVIDRILSHHIDIGFTGTVIEKGTANIFHFMKTNWLCLLRQMRNLLKSFVVDKNWWIGSWTSR